MEVIQRLRLGIFDFVRVHWPFLLFTFFYLLFTFFTYKDFGPTFDEKVEYDAGRYLLTYWKNPTSLEYVGRLVNSKSAHIEHRHLPLFSVYSRIYPALVNVLNPNFYFEWFHLQNMLLGWGLFLTAYTLFFLHYKDGRKAVIGPIFLAMTPVLLGHIPANPKDIPFATIYSAGLLGIYFFRTRKTNDYLEILVLGVVFGLAQSQRIVGLSLLIIYGLLSLLDTGKVTIGHFFNVFLKSVLIFFVSLLIWILALPFLGANLPLNFYELVVSGAGYAEWNHEVLYFGEFLKKAERPWHYLFVYLLLKLPLFTLIPFFVGGFFVLIRRFKYSRDHPVSLLFLAFIFNSGLYLALHPVVYNGIRHFLYLVVCLTLVAGIFFVDFLDHFQPRIRRGLFLVLVGYLLLVFARMVHLHPYQYIYFNEFSGGLPAVSGKFDVEYWGAAYKEGAEIVRGLATSVGIPDLKVYACDNHFGVVYYSQFQFELVGSPRGADIILCDLHKDTLRGYTSDYPVLQTIDREGVPIFVIRRNF